MISIIYIEVISSDRIYNMLLQGNTTVDGPRKSNRTYIKKKQQNKINFTLVGQEFDTRVLNNVFFFCC